MEQPPSDGQQHHPFPPLLYVPPLRIVAPPGVQPILPPTFNPQNPFDGFLSINGFPADTKMGDAEQQHHKLKPEPQVQPHRPISSAVRDYPLGCGRSSDSKGSSKKADSPPSVKKKAKGAGASKQGPDPQKGKQSVKGKHSGPSADSPSTPVPPHFAEASAATPGPSSAPAQSFNIPTTSSSKKAKRGPSTDPNPKSSKRPPPGSVHSTASPKRAVLETVRVYDAIRRNLLLEEEFKGKDAVKGSRPDLMSGSVLNSKGLAVNRAGKVVGHVPGVEVGDMFYFRMEICCIGMHGPIQAGIEYLTAKESEYGTPVAISVISAGGYDARDDGDELIYTGQGGKSAQDSKPNEDQKLERGNLAMEGSMKHQVPVRVTRGVKDTASPSGKTYIYDGLYKVEECWQEKGKFGFEEFKFRLRRLPGQPELGSAVIKLSNQLKYKPNMRQDMTLADLSEGKEGSPVCVVNAVDDETRPASFQYLTSVQCPREISQQFGKPQGCECRGSCSLSQDCSCFAMNMDTFAYLNNGILVKERGIIYECGSNCDCSHNCRNRVTQKVPKYRFEVFKTEDRGWGLRSWDIIPAGSFVCEYTGKFVQDMRLLHNRDYVLNLGLMPENNPRWGDVSKYLETQASRAVTDITRPDLAIDASEVGNISRFINHSCSPNLLVQCVLQDQQDMKCPHVMLFAMDNIPPFRELTIDYGFELPTLENQTQGRPCLCKSEDCRKRFGY